MSIARARARRFGSTCGALPLAILLATASGVRAQGRDGFLRIQTNTTGAVIFVDDRRVGITPYRTPIALAAGEHALKMTRRGYTEYNEVVRIRSDRTTEVETALLPVSAVLRVSTNVDGAQVFLDGAFVGSTSATTAGEPSVLEYEAAPGEHSVRVTHPGRRDALDSVQGVAGEETSIRLVLGPLLSGERHEAVVAGPQEWYERPVVWAVGAGGVLAVTAAVILIAVAARAGAGPTEAERFCQASASGCIPLAY